MKCNKCGAELEEGAVFCGSCGAKAEPGETAPEAVNAADSAPEYNPQPVQQPVQPVQPVQTYAAPQQHFTGGDDGMPVSLGAWICRSLISLIPCVGWIIYIVMLFVWAFDTKYNSTSRNWAKAQLIFIAVSLVLSVIIFAAFGGLIGNIMYDITGTRNGYGGFGY